MLRAIIIKMRGRKPAFSFESEETGVCLKEDNVFKVIGPHANYRKNDCN